MSAYVSSTLQFTAMRLRIVASFLSCCNLTPQQRRVVARILAQTPADQAWVSRAQEGLRKSHVKKLTVDQTETLSACQAVMVFLCHKMERATHKRKQAKRLLQAVMAFLCHKMEQVTHNGKQAGKQAMQFLRELAASPERVLSIVAAIMSENPFVFVAAAISFILLNVFCNEETRKRLSCVIVPLKMS